MKLLLSDESLIARRAVAHGPLAPLARSLMSDLEPLRRAPLFIPSEKALLSRTGGRCEVDGTLLDFDPFERDVHRCPRCGRTYTGELHYRFWIYWYQLWLAERAVHAAVLASLGYTESRALAEAILAEYADRYASYPNADNVLGPSRLFFSTYLESIWLLQICLAADALSSANAPLVDRVRDRIIEPARDIVGVYDEGGSNRQVWNNAALAASAIVLGDERALERATFGSSGLTAHLSTNLLPDGTWYEGENYHLFAHRGLWYGVTMAETAGLSLPRDLLNRFQRGFSTPFLTALPDLTFPSRRDSQYAVSLRQWRVAEHCEVGLAREHDPTLEGALERLYRPDIPRIDTGRSRSSADVERNGPPSALDRADLGWRALLRALPTLPALEPIAPASVLLEAQGIAVFRRDAGRIYIGLDYGHSGGGHGHPDRLNLLLCDGDTRWLDDFGTGSYVDRSLHWYRSSLAHNAPFRTGASQHATDGRLLAYDEHSGIGWTSATAEVAPGLSVTRTIVAAEDYLIDEIEWSGHGGDGLDIPLHVDLELTVGSHLDAAPLMGGTGLEDGFDFVADTQVEFTPARTTVSARATAARQERLDLWASSSTAIAWWRAVAPGPPGSGDHAFRLLRLADGSGRIVFVWSVRQSVVEANLDDGIVIRLANGELHTHSRVANEWCAEIESDGRRRRVTLAGAVRDVSAQHAESAAAVRREPIIIRSTGETMFALGEDNYRRSEQSWDEAAHPSAQLRLSGTRSGDLVIEIDVPRSERTFVPSDAVNPFDNELPDVNGDGVQLYLETAAGLVGRVLVPERESREVRIRAIDGWTAPADITASWTTLGDGYRMRIRLARVEPLSIDVVVNEMPRGRSRRRGQLVLSGARGEFVYLRGDRHDKQSLIPIRFVDA